jgi:hypothetical protein
LRRCEDEFADWLTALDGITPDPQDLREFLGKFTIVDTRDGAPFDATLYEAGWPVLVPHRTGAEEDEQVTKCMVQLSRYGHIDPWGWDTRDLAEFYSFYHALVEIMKEEDGVSQAVENK